jgi:hypothetical protein
MAKYPRVSGSLFQAYNDIVYGMGWTLFDSVFCTDMSLAQEWTNVEVVDLEKCARGAIKGRKKNSVSRILYFRVIFAQDEIMFRMWICLLSRALCLRNFQHDCKSCLVHPFFRPHLPRGWPQVERCIHFPWQAFGDLSRYYLWRCINCVLQDQHRHRKTPNVTCFTIWRAPEWTPPGMRTEETT